MNNHAFNKLALGLVSALVIVPTVVNATSLFDPNFIISDEQMRNNTNWSHTDVQSFLNSKGSYLKTYQDTDAVDNETKTAAKIISDASKRYDINPKVLLVTLQKEQSLITDTNPTQTQLDWATGYAVCDSCSVKDEKVAKHKGFAIQVDDAAYTYDWYYKNKDVSNVKKMGVSQSIDGTTVVPKSWATAFLYTYTPHLHGNENFVKIWKSWFNQNYPNGTLLKSDTTGEVWLIQNQVKRKFKSQTVLITRADPSMIITIPDTELSNYTTGSEISLPNYSILKSGSNYYLLDYDTLRPFASYEVVQKLGYNPQEISEVTSADIAGLTVGKTITADAYAPVGIIYKVTDLDNKLYLIKDNISYPLLNNAVASANYKNLSIVEKKLEDLRKFEMSSDMKTFDDGTILKVKETGDLFVVENGMKRKFESEKAFLTMGYKKNNIVEIDRISSFFLTDSDPIYYAASYDAAELNIDKNTFLGDLAVNISDSYGSSLPSYIVAEYPTGKIISGKNIDIVRPIASFVKTFVGFESIKQGLDLSKTTTYNSSKHNDSGYSLWVSSGTVLRNKDILNTMLIGSYNNMARLTVAATGLTEKEMVAKINERFKEWGANSTTVADVSGLSANNVSTARDLLKIFTYTYRDSWDLKIITQKTRHDFVALTGQTYSINNSNKLSFDNANYKILASKTGYTDEAQSVLYLLIQSKKTDKQYTIITLGNSDYVNRFNESDKIAKWVSSKDLNLANE